MKKYYSFITSEGLNSFCNAKREEGYKIIVDCEGLYSHNVMVDDKKKEITMQDRQDGIIYITITLLDGLI